MAYQALLT